MPKLSIITPCHNAEKYVGQMIESVRSQTFTDWEHIIVDDGSTDSSAAIILPYLVDSRLRLVRQQNGGMCNARNRGLAASTKDSLYLYFLDADDCIAPDMLFTLVGYLDENSNVGLAFCDYININSQGQSIATFHPPRYIPHRFWFRKLPRTYPDTPFVSIMAAAPVWSSISVLRRSIYEQTSGWDEEFGSLYEETNLFCQFALISKIHFIARELYRYRRHDEQVTGSRTKKSRFLAQERKLYDTWVNKEELSDDQKLLVKTAWAFRRRWTTPLYAFGNANTLVRHGKLLKALRLYLGGTKRFFDSFFPY